VVEERDERESDRIRLVPFPSSIHIAIVCIVVLLGVLYLIIVLNLAPPPEENEEVCELGTRVISDTKAGVQFSNWGPSYPSCQTDLYERLFDNPAPTDVKIVLSNDTHSGTYTFPSFDHKILLNLESGDDMGTISYTDYADNQEINLADELRLENLGRESNYTLHVVWNSTDEILAMADFSTP
jgi:hypothetical protein